MALSDVCWCGHPSHGGWCPSGRPEPCECWVGDPRPIAAECARLRAALYEMRTYARHARLCRYIPSYPDTPVATCDCGFDAALAEYDAARAPEAG